MAIIGRITRQTIRKLTPANRVHDNPTPSQAMIAQARAERALLDLAACLRVEGVDADQVIRSIATRFATNDQLGKSDIGARINELDALLFPIIESVSKFYTDYSNEKYKREDAAAGDRSGEGIPQHSTDCKPLPPAVSDQIDRLIARDSVRQRLAKKFIRGADSLHTVNKRVEEEMKRHDAHSLPHTILGPGGDFDQPFYA